MGGNTAIQRVFCPLCCNACSSRAVEWDVAAPQPHGAADYGSAYAVFVSVFFCGAIQLLLFFFFLWRVQINCFGKLSSLGNTVNPCDTCIISITVRLLLAPRFTSVLPPSPLNPAFFIRFLCGIFGEILESETGAWCLFVGCIKTLSFLVRFSDVFQCSSETGCVLPLSCLTAEWMCIFIVYLLLALHAGPHSHSFSCCTKWLVFLFPICTC